MRHLRKNKQTNKGKKSGAHRRCKTIEVRGTLETSSSGAFPLLSVVPNFALQIPTLVGAMTKGAL